MVYKTKLIFKTIDKKWTFEEVNELVRLHRQKLPYKEIAQRLGRSVSSCQTEMHNIRCGIVDEWRENNTIMALRKKIWEYETEIRDLKEQKKYNTKEEIKEYQEAIKKILALIEKAGGVV